jgi:hypothetical protein
LSDAAISLDDMAVKTGVSANATGGADHHHLRRNQNEQAKNDKDLLEKTTRYKANKEFSKTVNTT